VLVFKAIWKSTCNPVIFMMTVQPVRTPRFLISAPIVLLIFTCLMLSSLQSSANAQSDRFKKRRINLVNEHVKGVDHGRPIEDTRVLEAMKTVKRHKFVPEEHLHRAYNNRPLPIGHGQTISQPYIVALMTDLLNLSPDDTVLEIGTGSGYQAAILGRLVDRVFSIEIIKALHRQATSRLEKLGYDNVTTRHGDGYYGWQSHAPYDAIIVTAAPSHIPPPLTEQLASGGRMVIPVGHPLRTQRLLLLQKTDDGNVIQRSISRVRFVPFTRDRK